MPAKKNPSPLMANVVRSGICLGLTAPCTANPSLRHPREAPLFEEVERSLAPETERKVKALPGQNDCGKSGLKKGRIVGGEPAQLGAWPWAVALGRRLTENNVWFFCGGTLITDQHVITAAHCVKELTYDPSHPEEGYEGLVARIGDLDLDDSVDDGAKPVTILVSRSEWHPKYSESWDGYDIALLTLKTPVEFSDLARPACLPTESVFYKNKDFEGYHPFVAGWGYTKEGGEKSNKLMQLQVPLLSTEECASLIASSGAMRLHEDSFCAYEEGKDSCQGDSGGPLMLFMDSKYYLYGVVSYGNGCARKNNPGVYNKVHTHLKWITGLLESARSDTT
ncbi:venom protease-like isoform X1 [Bemisia tabaci]|uniref:venom protease-like isoform X1 n=1 Tax=Bemisia tabaci TaxID=7038 RepID=UPI003B285A74